MLYSKQMQKEAVMIEHMPMRRKTREVKDPTQIKALIDECQTVRLGLVDDEGIFIVPVSYGYEWVVAGSGNSEHLVLWVHSAQEGRKARALAANSSNIAVELDAEGGVITAQDACKCSCAYRSIMGTATAQLAEIPAQKMHGMDLIMQHQTKRDWGGYSQAALERTNIYRIEVQRLTCKVNTKA